MKSKDHKVFAHLKFGLLFIFIAGSIFTPKIYSQAEDEERSNERGASQMKASTTASSNLRTQEDLIETQISAYKAVACSANEINAKIARISKLKGKTLMVYDEELVTTLSEYSVLKRQLENLIRNYSSEELSIFSGGAAAAQAENPDGNNQSSSLKDKVAGLLDPIESIQNSFFDTLSRFKTDTDIVGTNAAIAKEEFIAKAVDNLDISVFYPNMAIPIISDAEESDPRDLLELLRVLAEKRVEAQLKMAFIERTAKLLEDQAENDVPASVARLFSDGYFKLKVLNEQYDRTLSQFGIFSVTDSFENVVLEDKWNEMKDDEPQKQYYEEQEGPPKNYRFNRQRWRKTHGYPTQKSIVDYLRAEIAYKLIKPGNVYWFDVNIAAAGSNRRTQTNAVLDVFRGGNKQTFSSGAVVSFRIFKSNGEVIVSDTMMTYMPYQKAGEITEYVCRPTNTNSVP